jgi:putative endonuclease
VKKQSSAIITNFNTKLVPMERGGFIYILTNKNNSALYTGVTSNIVARIFEHKAKKHSKSFSAKYNLNKLVYFETFYDIEEAIAREKQIKAGPRQAKIKLIEQVNPNWDDLYNEVCEY